MESVCGIEQGSGGDHAVDARNGCTVRSAQSVSGRGEHSRWSRISCSLKQKFNGDLRLITAAYYVGESTISSRGLEYSSPDVQRYVKRVAQRYRARRVFRERILLARQREKLR